MKDKKVIQPPENKMGVMSTGKLLFSMAVPMMLSMLVQAFYNIVDSVFVSQISENALTAVSLAFPLQNLMIACGAGTAVGIGLACIGAGLAVFTGFGSGIGEGNVAAHALDAIARNPEVSKDIRSNMILGIALTETTGIYGFAIAILILIMALF